MRETSLVLQAQSKHQIDVYMNGIVKPKADNCYVNIYAVRLCFIQAIMFHV
jgi:hypothetical protein